MLEIIRKTTFSKNAKYSTLIQADYSIPTADEVVEGCEVHNLKQINQIRSLLEAQIKLEHELLKNEKSIFTTMQPPPPATNFKSSRLLFSHLGLLGLDSVQKQSNPSDNSDLIRLRGTQEKGRKISLNIFLRQKIVNRYYQTVSEFYSLLVVKNL